MSESIEAIYLYIPLMKELGMSWYEIKNTPRFELEGLMSAFGSYNLLHAFDGYSSDNIGEMAKKNPEVRTNYNNHRAFKLKMEEKMGKKKKVQSFSELVK
tara:strand:+ start:635 stop:934 length:300 start_codon:yes stop_codon:yes gene_type:complete